MPDIPTLRGIRVNFVFHIDRESEIGILQKTGIIRKISEQDGISGIGCSQPPASAAGTGGKFGPDNPAFPLVNGTRFEFGGRRRFLVATGKQKEEYSTNEKKCFCQHSLIFFYIDKVQRLEGWVVWLKPRINKQ